MSVQDVMAELELRGVEYDVLAPAWKLAELLARERAAEPAAPRKPSASPPPPPQPARPARSAGPSAERSDRRPAAAPTPSRAAAKVADPTAADVGVESLADSAVELVGSLASAVATTAVAVPALANEALNTSRGGDWPKEVPDAWRRALARGPWRS
eukprot:5373236-Prymnesium_polylepis.1